CKNIVDAHEGTITAETSSLGGLKISIKLPRD
ncbi:MAG: signal transduction histidine kinase, partial [Planctomycetota bacterium]